jgi:NitT/TauT family transport system substrate-binding protein
VQETAGVPSAFVGFGIEKGIFTRQGLDVDLQAAQGGATAIPSLVNGDVQVAGSNVVSLLLAAGKGVPIRAIAGGTSTSRVRRSP